jgi:S-(hydroxymethyl)glutathione dehydrogenase / alcohol dehydrogenase
MKTEAAILVETGRPLDIVELDVPALQAGQVLVEIAYSGVCHTQLSEARGHRGVDRWLPHCLGHEGTGRVLETGPAVTRVKPGQEVILSWIRGAGAEAGGVAYRWGERVVNAGLITTFQRHAVVSESRLTPNVAGVDLKAGVVLGCALPTGFGAVVNVARVRPGEAVAVLGTGGVGLCAVIGAAMAGAHPIIAIDLNPAKLELARRLGASHAIDAASDMAAVEEAVRAATGGGLLDVAIEATGLPSVMATALRLVRPQGGRAVVIGNARFGDQLSFDPAQLNQGKSLLGTWGGDSVPERDYPRYGRLLAAGRIAVEPLLNRSYTLDGINQALADLEVGKAFRPVIAMRPD